MTKIITNQQGKVLVANGNKVFSMNGGDNPEAGMNDVIFCDYDGTIRYSYSKADFANLTALPANPSHTGLTAQGWNWTLADAKAHIAKYGQLIIGQMYTTSDGKTRLYISIPTTGRMTIPLYFYQSDANGVTIDWGDNSATETVSTAGTKNTSHTYSSIGDYVITMIANSGTYKLGSGDTNVSVLGQVQNATRWSVTRLRRVEIGASASINSYAFGGCWDLTSLTIPNTVIGTIGSNIFQNTGLMFVVIPSSLTGVGANCFYGSVASLSLPNTLSSANTSNWFAYDYKLTHITIPEPIVTLNNYFAYMCYSLVSVKVPDTVSTIKNSAFYNCYGLKEVWMYPTTPPTLNANAFTGCPADMVIYVPKGKLTTYQGASNWSAYSSQMVEMSA